MSKVNRKAVEANLRNKLAAQYKEKTESLQKEKAELEKKYNELWREACKLKEERNELQGKISVYEDWNRRLQEFMDMSEVDRQKYVENLRTSEKLNKTLEHFEYMSHLFSGLFV